MKKWFNIITRFLEAKRCLIASPLLLTLCLSHLAVIATAAPGDEVVVVYNTATPESKDVAYYYASKRGVPTNQVFGFDLPTGEQTSRKDFQEKLQKPLLKALEDNHLLVFGPGKGEKPTGNVVTEAKIRYAVMCYGVPVRILKDPTINEPGMEGVRDELRRNEASVDSDLAILPQYYQSPHLYGPLHNPLYRTTNSAAINPTNGILMVTRLDGPSAAIAKGLVDKALQADAEGLWGRAYFDIRNTTNANYKIGDDWIRTAADIVRRLGYETIIDERPNTFAPEFALSQVAFYAGWYDAAVSGPFAATTVEFMPGAFAYHLHSFNAASIRTTYEHWVGPLLARGVTATMGSVDEPYLEGTPDISAFFWSFVKLGYSFGESAYSSVESLSWQTTVIGDPLYRPFAIAPQNRHEALVRAKSKLLEWSFLKVVNINLASGASVPELIDFLDRLPEARTSAVLQEKLGDMSYDRAKFIDAIDAYDQALKFDMTQQQRIRVTLSLAKVLGLFQRKERAFELYEQFLKDFPNYPAVGDIRGRMLSLARDLKRTNDVQRLEQEIKSPAPAK